MDMHIWLMETLCSNFPEAIVFNMYMILVSDGHNDWDTEFIKKSTAAAAPITSQSNFLL